jgi:tetratricopeptide (TPR) repeat protein
VTKKTVVFLAGLAFLALAGLGVVFRQYYAVAVFISWVTIELVWRLYVSKKPSYAVRLGGLRHLFSLYGKHDVSSIRLLDERIRELRFTGRLCEEQQKWLEKFSALVELRALWLGADTIRYPLGSLRSCFVYSKELQPVRLTGEFSDTSEIAESAAWVADLYWRLFENASGNHRELSVYGKQLFEEIFGERFEVKDARNRIEKLTDSMQREGGMSFLILRLLSSGEYESARKISRTMLEERAEMDEDTRSALYWLSEVLWFGAAKPTLDYESCIRFLYHFCFTTLDRCGVLEIDSQFFPQFESLNEIVREGLLFKETLIDMLLRLWGQYENVFDSLFVRALEILLEQRSKVYDSKKVWEQVWNRAREDFCRDALYVVEGNLSYASGHFEQARNFYEKALEMNPMHRAASLNIVLAHARLGDVERHGVALSRVLGREALMPSALYVAGDSHLLLGDEKSAEPYYKRLRSYPGWHDRVEYYKSMFCYEHGLLDQALRFAEQAYSLYPNDTAISFHLSLCYSAAGRKEKALELVEQMREVPQWLNYYRFTLERDSGKFHKASETLLNIPSDYFQDNEELEAALEFARNRRDLVLLRHLRAGFKA